MLLLVALGAAGCLGSGRNRFVGSWEAGADTIVIHPNGLAEGRLFAASERQSYTWRADGQAIVLTFGRIASDTVEYRGALDDSGHLVIEGEPGRCVLVRLVAVAAL